MNRKGEWGQNLTPKLVIEGQEFLKPGSKRKNDPQGRKYAQKGQNGQNQALEQDNEDQCSENPPKRKKYKPEQNVKHERGQKIRSGPLTVKGILGKMAQMREERGRVEPITAPETQKPEVFHKKGIVFEQNQREGEIRASTWAKANPTANHLTQRERADFNPLGMNSGVNTGINQGQVTGSAYKQEGQTGSSLLCLTDQTVTLAIQNLTEEGQGAGPQGPPSCARKYSGRKKAQDQS